jgi:hypothetical protein
MAFLLKSDEHTATALLLFPDGRKLHIASLDGRFLYQSFLVERACHLVLIDGYFSSSCGLGADTNV